MRRELTEAQEVAVRDFVQTLVGRERSKLIDPILRRGESLLRRALWIEQRCIGLGEQLRVRADRRRIAEAADEAPVGVVAALELEQLLTRQFRMNVRAAPNDPV